jgi:predicted dehydrogenase
LGPAPLRSFNKNRFHGLWRLFWDYGGGLQTDWGVHLIDMGLWGMGIEGFPRSVIGSGGIFAHRDHALETMDTQTVVYAFEGFQMTWEHHGGIQTGPWGRNYGIAFMGTNGTLVADRDNWEVIPEWDEGKPRMEAGSPQKSDQKDHEKHVADFLSCVKTRQRPAADVEIGRNSAMFAHLGNIAVRTGHTLVWNDTAGRFENDPDADALIKPVYRSPWIFPEV